MLSVLRPRARKEAVFPPLLLSCGMVQEQSSLILLKVEGAAEGNLVVNPFERDKAHVECEPSDKMLFFFFLTN